MLSKYSSVLYIVYLVIPTVRACAVRDDNNKDYVCEPTIPAGLKCPRPSKTISLITWFEAHLNTLSERIREGLGEVYGLYVWDPETVSVLYRMENKA